jgi:hypothetical protein
MTMYRQYENPAKVQKMLEAAEEELARAKEEDPENIDLIIDLANEVESLKERLNFAWQDDEYDEEYAREMYSEEEE